MKVIDLAMNVQPHWRWTLEFSLLNESPRVTGIRTGAHGFTHMDTPLHVEPGRPSIDQLPITATVGQALVIDLTFIGANQGIEKEHLLPYESKIQEGDIVLLKTCWDEHADYNSAEYWEKAPYVTKEAAQWLAQQPIKAVGFDFPQDYNLRYQKHFPVEEQTTHNEILRKGIYMIEYMCNFGEITQERVFLCAQPIKYVGAEGSPVRAIAIEGWK